MSDTLRSVSYARIVDLIGEGEIGGLVAGAQSIYLDETPLQNEDGTFNFPAEGFKWVQRTGTLNQDHIQGFAGVESTTGVGLRVYHAIPLVRTISNPNVDAVSLIVSTPALQRTDRDTGDIERTPVQMKVEVQAAGGAYYEVGLTTAGAPIPADSPTQLKMVSPQVGTRADITVKFMTYAASPSDRVIQYRIEYRKVGALTWSTYGTGSVYADKTSQVVVGSSTITKYSGTSLFTRNDLPQDAYEFRLINVSGTDGITFAMSGIYYGLNPGILLYGKVGSRYQRQVTFNLSGNAPWNIRVTRVTADSDSSYLQNDTYWDSFTAITDDKLRMPHSALIAMTIDSRYFSNIPNRAFDVRLLKVRVPSNYDPLKRTYTGMWDGTFKAAKEWTDNPAWCFYDLLTNPRYGLGQFVGTGVDKWSLYQIAQYCDEMVDDGQGGMEPRFTCNVWFATRAEAYKIVQDMASIFRGMVYWASGSITAVQDAPSDPVALFSPANVEDGVFTYGGSSAKVRHTAALVTWNDPADMCRQKVEYVEDRAGIDRYGLVQTEIVAIGCNSRGQATRVGKWLLYSERAQTETVTFKTGIESVNCRPGQVVKIADPLRAGVRYGGRLIATGTSSVTIDAPVELLAGQTYTLACLDSAGQVQETAVTNAAGTGISTLSLSPALAEAPIVGSMWVLTCDQVEAQLFRVVSVDEVERAKFQITALAEDPGKFDEIENGVILQPRSYSVLSAKPSAVDNLAVGEALYPDGATLATRLDVSWTLPANSTAAVVSWVRDDGTVSPEQTVYTPSIELHRVIEGQTYTFTVYAMSPLGVRSASASTLTHTVLGKQAPPSDVQGFVVSRTGETLTFNWRAITDLDAARYEIRRGDEWDSGYIVGSAPHPTTAWQMLAPRGGKFLIKAFDSSGNESLNATMLEASDVSGINVVASIDEASTGFAGTCLLSTTIYTDNLSPTWDAASSWDSAVTWDAWTTRTGVTLASGASAGLYQTTVIDIGDVLTSALSVETVVQTLGYMEVPWTAYTEPWSTYSGGMWVWQAPEGHVGVTHEIRYSEDGVTWSDWLQYAPGTYRFRYIQAQATLRTDNVYYRPLMTSLRFIVDVPDRVERYEDVAVPVDGVTISFVPEFVRVQTIHATVQSGAVGDTVRLTGKSETGVTVQVYSSADVAKPGLVDIDVWGYGEKY